MLRNWSGVGGGGDDNIPCTCLAHMLDATQLVGDDNIPCTCTHVGCYATGLQHRHVVHQLKQFTGEVETARGASKIAGTQCVDRLWQSLKRILPPKLAAKDPKTKTISRAFGHIMIYSFAWRKSLGPRTGPQFLEELSRVWWTQSSFARIFKTSKTHFF